MENNFNYVKYAEEVTFGGDPVEENPSLAELVESVYPRKERIAHGRYTDFVVRADGSTETVKSGEGK
jgi:hypothetical protein